jgi:hypothetical protein
MSRALEPAAQAYGQRTARKLLAGRKGHGGGPCMKRIFNEAELIALCAIAYADGRSIAFTEAAAACDYYSKGLLARSIKGRILDISRGKESGE